MSVTPTTANDQFEAHQLAKNGITAKYWMDEAWFTVTPEMAKDAPVVLPTPFNELAEEQQKATPWTIDPEKNELDLSAAKQMIRDLGLIAPSDIPAVAAQQADQVAEIAKAIVKKKTENDKLLEWQKIQLELGNIKARKEAERLYKTENTDADLSLFDGTLSLAEALQADYELAEWRVKGMLRVGHITTVAGMAKAGKTSFLVNRVRSFVDNRKLFGEFEVGKELTGNVGVWNFELTPGQMVDWFRKSGIVNTHKVRLVNARGAGLFIQNELVVEKAIEWINRNEIEVLEIDPLQAAFQGSIISDEDAADFITALQRIQKESCVSDIILTTHMGHAARNDPAAQRSIGSARWEGFADNLIIFTREDGKPAKLRIDRGRDIQLDEISLEMDPETKLLKKVFVPKPIDDNWNAVISALKTSDVVDKKELTEVNGQGGNKTKINAYINDLKKWGLVDEWSMKKDGSGNYTNDGTKGQAKLFLTMNEIGKKLLREQELEQEIPDRMWWEGQASKGVQGVQGG